MSHRTLWLLAFTRKALDNLAQGNTLGKTGAQRLTLKGFDNPEAAAIYSTLSA